jgi:hypothetical protein
VSIKDWTEVFRGQRWQADVIGAVLDANGLRVEVLAANVAYGLGIDLSDARVMVPDEEAEAARELIRQAEQPSGESEV